MDKHLISGLLVTFLIFLVLSTLTFFGIFENLKFYFITLLLINILIFIYYKFRKNYVKFLAFLIPMLIFIYIIYLNLHPLGYSKEYTLNIDNQGDIKTNSKSFYIQDLKGNKLNNLSSLHGAVELVIEPKSLANNYSVSVNLSGKDVYLENYKEIENWDYSFDFSSGIPDSLLGKADYDENNKCVSFTGNDSLYLSNSSDLFETGPFIIYAEYVPEKNNKSFQQIVGHYNWELLQDEDKVRFNIGRMNIENQTSSNLIGKMYSITSSVKGDFFNKKHHILAIYNPNEKGYIALFIDGKFSGITLINNDTIWVDYNWQRPLSFGKSGHSGATYFVGCLYKFGFKEGNLEYYNNYNLNINENKIIIPVFGNGNLELIKIDLKELK